MSKIVEEWRVNEYEALKRADRRNTVIFATVCTAGAAAIIGGLAWLVSRAFPVAAHAIIAALS